MAIIAEIELPKHMHYIRQIFYVTRFHSLFQKVDMNKKFEDPKKSETFPLPIATTKQNYETIK